MDIIQVIIVNHDSAQSTEIQKAVKESGLAEKVKIAVNCGHALLYIDHLHLNGRIQEGEILVLLDMHTPIVNGISFLKEFQALRHLKKEKIRLAVMDKDLSEEQKQKIMSFGKTQFIPFPVTESTLREITSTCNGTEKGTPLAA